MIKRKLVVSIWVRAVVGSFAALVFAMPTYAAPTANDLNLTLAINGDVDVTFNIHDMPGMTSGGPAPVYLFESILAPAGTVLPPGLSVTRVGNACVRIQWSETTQDPFPEAFGIPFTLIAGDLSRSNQARIIVEQGGEPLPAPADCDIDPSNVEPQVTTNPISVQTIQGTSVAVSPVPPAGTAVTDIAGTVRLTDTSCWVQPTNGTATRVSDTQISYSPNDPAFTGSDSFEYCVTDNPLDNSTGPRGRVNVEVLTVNAPEVVDDPSPGAPPLQTEIGVAFDIDVMANDPINDAGTLLSASTPANGGAAQILPENACSVAPTAAGQGCIQYTPPGPDPDGIVFVGTDSFNYVVSDAASGLTAQATVTVNVVAPPGTPEPGIVAVSGVVAGQPTIIDVLAAATDDGGIFEMNITNVSTPTSGTAVITPGPNQTPVITYTPDVTFSGSDSFLYTIADSDPTTIDRVARVTINVVSPAVLALLEGLAANTTQESVAAAIDVVCPALADLQASDPNNPLPPGQQDLLTRCSALIDFADDPDNLTGVQSALQQIAGEEVFAQGTTGTRVVNTQIRNIGSRLAALRSGATGISAQGLTMNFDSGALPIGSMFAQNGGGASADDDPGSALLADSRLGIFINGRANFGDQDTTLDEAGFDFDTLGITLGADYRFRSNLVIGGAIGYADSEVEFNFDGGDLQTEALTYSLYATYFTEKIYFDILAGTGSSDYDTRRIMLFEDGTSAGVNTIALGTTDGDQSLLSMNLGYNFENKGWLIAPYISYDYLSTDVKSYNETEGQGWELAFDDQEVKSKVVTGGLRIAYNKTASFGVFVPHVRVAFQKELEDDVRAVNVRFVNDPTNTNFEFLTAVPDTDFYRVGAGFSIVWANGLSGFVDYESIQGYDNLTSSTLTAGLRIERRFN